MPPEAENNAPPSPTNGAAEPQPVPRSIREVAEEVYDELLDGGEEGASTEAPVDDSGRPRDKLGRFVAKETETGEAEGSQPTQPRQEITAPPAAQPSPTQPREGVAAEAPANWPADKRETFAKLSPDWQEYLLERHHAMESDYQRRVQATAQAAGFANAVAPVFNHPVLSRSLQQNGISPQDAIGQWGAMHLRFLQDPVGLARDLLQRAGIDPAALAMSRPGQPAPALSEKDLADPAIRHFADHLGRISNDNATLRAELQNMRQQAAHERQEEMVRVARWGVDAFADEKGPDGKPLRPDFAEALPELVAMFKANPQLDMAQAYEEARWRTPSIRQRLLAEQQQRQQHTLASAAANQRAAQAARSNVRGITSPVSKPQPADGERKGLRAVIESTADELGYQ